MGGKTIWVISGEQWLRACIRAELIERGYEAVGFYTLADAGNEIGRRSRPDVILVDLHGQVINPSEMEGMASLQIPIVGIAALDAPADPRITQFTWAEMLRRPLTIGEVADKIEDLLGRNASQTVLSKAPDS